MTMPVHSFSLNDPCSCAFSFAPLFCIFVYRIASTYSTLNTQHFPFIVYSFGFLCILYFHNKNVRTFLKHQFKTIPCKKKEGGKKRNASIHLVEPSIHSIRSVSVCILHFGIYKINNAQRNTIKKNLFFRWHIDLFVTR